jgi:transcription elongation factor Elf1
MIRTTEKEETVMVKYQYAVGDRVDKLCAVCKEERGHIVALLNKQGQISRVSCPQCGTRSTFKSGKSVKTPNSPPYDWTRTYRKGQTMMHPTFGLGEVTAVIEPQKIDVLFSDRVRRLFHAHASI